MSYVSIESLLYDLSLSMDPSTWNTSAAKEWALQSVRGIGGLSIYTDKVEYYVVSNHKLKLPEGFRVLNQIQIYTPSIANNLDINQQLLERIQRRIDHPSPELFLEGSSGYNNLGPYGQTISGTINTYADKWETCYKSSNAWCSSCDPHAPSKCVPEYKEQMDSIHFSFANGLICVSYKAYAEKDGEYLLADIPSLKEAVRYYVLYRIYDAACRVEPNQFSVAERDRCMKLYSTYKLKAVGDINSAHLDIGQMENLKMMNNKFIKGNAFDSGFRTLNQPGML